MKYLETEHERKSLVITTIIYVVILILCFFLGMTYIDPPPENGIAINFGTSEVGMGEIQPTEAIQSAPQQVQAVAQPTPVEEEVITQDVNDAPVITNKKPQKETPKEVEKPKEKPKEAPKPSKTTTDALSNILNGPKSNGKATGGQGDDNKRGDKGKIGGTLDGSYGGGGDGGTAGSGNGNYQLAGRKVLVKPRPKYICNEQGTVVVEISVNQQGKVISAQPGVRGTTNSAKCLLDQAQQAALNTKFDSSSSAPNKQVGKIIYNFKLTD